MKLAASYVVNTKEPVIMKSSETKQPKVFFLDRETCFERLMKFKIQCLVLLVNDSKLSHNMTNTRFWLLACLSGIICPI